MIADGLAIDDCSKRAAEVTHVISSVPLLDYEMVARQPERRGIIEFEVCLQGRLPFFCKGHSANDKRQIPEFDWSLQLMLHLWVLRRRDRRDSKTTEPFGYPPLPALHTLGFFAVRR